MINLAVINLKDIIKFIRNFFIGIIIFIILIKICGNIKDGNYVEIKDLKEKSFFDYCKIIDRTLIISSYYKNSETTVNKSGIKKILGSEFAILDMEEEIMEKENQEEVLEFENTSNIESTEEIKTETVNVEENVNDEKVEKKLNEIEKSLPTTIIKENNKTDTFTDTYKSVKIKNESKYQLTEEIVAPNFELSNKSDVIIYHTHTCESYTPTQENNYEASGNFRTTDLNYNVSRVGNELEKYLTNTFNVKHNNTYHDFPAYSGSYTRSLATIKSIVPEKYSGLVIDLHRDALGSNSDYAPRIKIGDEVVAQLMFVIGTNGGGLEHSNWERNLKTAIKIQEKANEMYPGLFKPIILRNSRYNQHVSDGACIIEVGATGNTLEECTGSMKYLAKVIEEVLK